MWNTIVEKLYKSSLEYYTNWRPHVKELALALVVVLIIRSMVGVIYRIPTGSMKPTLTEGDILVASRFYYGLKLPFTEGIAGFKLPALREVAVGDPVIFRAPEEALFYDVRILYENAIYEENADNLDGEEQVVLGLDDSAGIERPVGNDLAFAKSRNELAAKNSEDTKGSSDVAVATKIERERMLLNTLNEAASFKRALSLRKDEIDLNWLASATNYIFLNPGKRSVTLHLPAAVYRAYRHEMEVKLNILSVYERRSTLTFADKSKDLFMMRLLQPLMTTGSIIATAFINSPLMLPYKYVFLVVEEKSLLPPHYVVGTMVKLYPNRYLKLHREYVKRVVAMEGDKIEIRNKQLWINDELVPWENETIDTNDVDFTYFDEMMAYSTKKSNGGAGIFAHPVRVSKLEIKPFTKFDAALWPLDTESPYAIGFRDNFGPVTVPKDSYFVMGDNRDESLDSRYIGFLTKWEIRGKPMYIIFPRERRGRIE
ncbi:signal peptidase I P [Spirochaetota bacterium]|nr:signal peptidase I P [Spirochaetota bacterium]